MFLNKFHNQATPTATYQTRYQSCCYTVTRIIYELVTQTYLNTLKLSNCIKSYGICLIGRNKEEGLSPPNIIKPPKILTFFNILALLC